MNERTEALSTDIKFPWYRPLLRSVATAAVLLDGTYSGFLFETAPAGLKAIFVELGIELTPTMTNYITYGAIPLILCNLITDLSAVDIMHEADDLALAFSKDKKEQLAVRSLILGISLKVLAILGNYPVGACADAIPVSDLIVNYMSSKSAEALRYSSLIVIGGLEVLYYIMFTNARLQNHASALFDTLQNFPAFCKDIFKQPGAYLETLIQVSANAANRGIAFAFITQDLQKKFFNINPGSKIGRDLSIAVGLNSINTTFFSRFLNTYRKFLNPDFKFIKAAEYKQASGLNSAFILDGFFSLIRGGALGMLTYELLNLSQPLKYTIAGGIGTVVSLHSAATNYTMRRNRDALAKIPKDELAQRKAALIQQLEEQDNSSKSEEQPLLPVAPTIKDPATQKLDLYNKLASNMHSKKLSFAVDVVTNITQLVRLLAFYLFVQTLNDVLLGNSIGSKALFALTLFWGSEVFKNDRELYRGAVTDNWTGIAARWQLEKQSELQKTVSTNPQDLWCGFLKPRPVRVLTKNVYDYSDKMLEEALHETDIEGSSTPGFN